MTAHDRLNTSSDDNKFSLAAMTQFSAFTLLGAYLAFTGFTAGAPIVLVGVGGISYSVWLRYQIPSNSESKNGSWWPRRATPVDSDDEDNGYRETASPPTARRNSSTSATLLAMEATRQPPSELDVMAKQIAKEEDEKKRLEEQKRMVEIGQHPATTFGSILSAPRRAYDTITGLLASPAASPRKP